METLIQDVRYGLRMLRKSPGLTAVAVLTLALGIGANSTIFSWINGTLLNPIPGVSHASDCVELTGLSYPDYVDLRDRNHSFFALVAVDLYPMELTGNENPQHVWGVFSTANYFEGLGVKPILGRGFSPEEGEKPNAAPVVVLSYDLWETRFGGERSVIGRVIQVNKHAYTVIGVAPPDFVGTQAGLQADLWVPTSMVEQLHDLDLLPARGDTWLLPIGRLKPGVTREQAQAEMNVLMQQIVREHPDSHQGDNSITLYPLWRAPFGMNGLHPHNPFSAVRCLGRGSPTGLCQRGKSSARALGGTAARNGDPAFHRRIAQTPDSPIARGEFDPRLVCRLPCDAVHDMDR